MRLRHGDSRVHKILLITHDIYKSFDANPSLEVRGLFLNMSKAFDRAWHECLLFKLKRLNLSGKYYGTINSFLRNRPPKSSPEWSVVQVVFYQSRVPSGINFRYIVFLVYINDLPNELLSNPKLFADDASIPLLRNVVKWLDTL